MLFGFFLSIGEGVDYSQPIKLELSPMLSGDEVEFEPTDADAKLTKSFQYVTENAYGSAPK